ncbi:MAG TPA: oxidoreductase [Candidatus Latescibacteria bacterium]|nr:oxidoreductase [Candidatus Latescibacterota bacterium]
MRPPSFVTLGIAESVHESYISTKCVGEPMGIRIGICGVGAFANSFIPLFKAHPEVEQVILCDLDDEKLKEKSDRFELPDTCPSLDDLCERDVDAIAIITQHHLHGPQAVQVLQSGKHVYSAVPSAITVDEITELVKTVEETGQIYMIGETSYYYPCTIYCRERYNNGDFGHIVYGEAEYHHDYVHGSYAVSQWRHGEKWKQYYGMPPLFYPTHSTSMIVSVTDSHATHVCGMGFEDKHEDNLYARKDNVWKNPFSNETMMCKMSDGSYARINEFRRIGHPGTVGMSLYGTEAGYEEQVGAQMWITKDRKKCVALTDELSCEGVEAGPADDPMGKVTGEDGTHSGASSVHPVHLLPREFIGLGNGHKGAHQFLVHDFVSACVSGETPPNNVWQAARYLIPGLIAHESAMQGGVLMEVPDLGDCPG